MSGSAPCRLLLLLLHFCIGRKTTEDYKLDDEAEVQQYVANERRNIASGRLTRGSVFGEARPPPNPQAALGNALPGAGSAQAGRAGAAREDRRGGGRGRLAGTVVLEQNIHAASAG